MLHSSHRKGGFPTRTNPCKHQVSSEEWKHRQIVRDLLRERESKSWEAYLSQRDSDRKVQRVVHEYEERAKKRELERNMRDMRVKMIDDRINRRMEKLDKLLTTWDEKETNADWNTLLAIKRFETEIDNEVRNNRNKNPQQHQKKNRPHHNKNHIGGDHISINSHASSMRDFANSKLYNAPLKMSMPYPQTLFSSSDPLASDRLSLSVISSSSNNNTHQNNDMIYNNDSTSHSLSLDQHDKILDTGSEMDLLTIDEEQTSALLSLTQQQEEKVEKPEKIERIVQQSQQQQQQEEKQQQDEYQYNYNHTKQQEQQQEQEKPLILSLRMIPDDIDESSQSTNVSEHTESTNVSYGSSIPYSKPDIPSDDDDEFDF